MTNEKIELGFCEEINRGASEEYQIQQVAVMEKRKALKDSLSEEQRYLLEALEDEQGDLRYIESRDMFYAGFVNGEESQVIAG
ncbi:MAG: hypothetical protein EOM42_06765 [Negativicutes bacterium]|nr:hypothetical protein [Negativicutes bacterium]